jgi:hypothetical protein
LGKDDMGGVAAGRVTALSVGGANAVMLGGAGGLQTHALVGAENGPHQHGYTQLGGGFMKEVGAAQVNALTTMVAALTDISGSGTPHSTTPPWLALNKAIWGGAIEGLEPTAFSDGFAVGFY